MPISLSGSLLITGSITTTGGITISGSILSASYSATSSFSNDFTVLGNLTVFGTQSVQYITSSQLNISDNVITVNVASPGVRFGGLSVFDSGSLSSEATASLFWDSQNNHWIYQRESGSTYDGGMLISGPRNAAGLGNEQGTTNCMLLVGQGGDHLTSSMIYHSSAVTCVPNILNVGGVLSGTCATFRVSADRNLAAKFDSNIALSAESDSGAPESLRLYSDTLRIYTATTAVGLAERFTIANTGVSCFSCQVCAPSYISSNASNVSYQDGQYIVGNSESEVCALGPATSAYVPMKYWIADRTGTIRTKFAAYIVSGPNYWAYQFRKNGSSVIANGHYNNTLEPGYCSNVHAYTTFTNVLCNLAPGDCVTYEMASANSGGTPINGSGTQCFYVKELRFLSNSPSISNNFTNNVFGQWVGLGTSCPFSNLYVQGNNEASYDASVDNGQDGCGVTMTIRNGSTVTNSFAQLNMQVSGDSGRAVGRIALIRKDSASSHMAFVIETANAKTEIMRMGCFGASSHNFIMVGRTNAGISAGTGITLNATTGQIESSVSGDDILNLNRNVSDGKIIRLFKNCTEVGSISTNANSLPSDANFKTNINSLNLGLNLVSKLRPVSYNHKLDDSGSPLSTGFIAQEMQCVLDELGVERNNYFILQHKPVEDQKESQYWLDYTKMIPVLTKAIQEQQCTICSQASMINTLKTCIGIA
jgi:hypothetical protein